MVSTAEIRAGVPGPASPPRSGVALAPQPWLSHQRTIIGASQATRPVKAGGCQDGRHGRAAVAELIRLSARPPRAAAGWPGARQAGRGARRHAGRCARGPPREARGSAGPPANQAERGRGPASHRDRLASDIAEILSEMSSLIGPQPPGGNDGAKRSPAPEPPAPPAPPAAREPVGETERPSATPGTVASDAATPSDRAPESAAVAEPVPAAESALAVEPVPAAAPEPATASQLVSDASRKSPTGSPGRSARA